MFELIYDVKYSDIIYEYYDIYKDGKPYYKDKRLSYILSLEIDRCSETMKFVNVTDEIYIEIFFDRQKLYSLILSLCDELEIKGYKVIGKDLLSKELYYILEYTIKEEE